MFRTQSIQPYMDTPKIDTHWWNGEKNGEKYRERNSPKFWGMIKWNSRLPVIKCIKVNYDNIICSCVWLFLVVMRKLLGNSSIITKKINWRLQNEFRNSLFGSFMTQFLLSLRCYDHWQPYSKHKMSIFICSFKSVQQG